jgi:hypothetical protein
MFGIFELFGASRPQRRLDAALRAVGVHPRLVPDAVKLTVIRQLQGRERQGGADETACAHAAEMLGRLMHGRGAFIDDNGSQAARETEDRIAAAIGAGDGPDARLIMLALHAGLVAPEVVDEFELTID